MIFHSLSQLLYPQVSARWLTDFRSTGHKTVTLHYNASNPMLNTSKKPVSCTAKFLTTCIMLVFNLWLREMRRMTKYHRVNSIRLNSRCSSSRVNKWSYLCLMDVQDSKIVYNNCYYVFIVKISLPYQYRPYMCNTSLLQSMYGYVPQLLG